MDIQTYSLDVSPFPYSVLSLTMVLDARDACARVVARSILAGDQPSTTSLLVEEFRRYDLSARR